MYCVQVVLLFEQKRNASTCLFLSQLSSDLHPYEALMAGRGFGALPLSIACA